MIGYIKFFATIGHTSLQLIAVSVSLSLAYVSFKHHLEFFFLFLRFIQQTLSPFQTLQSLLDGVSLLSVKCFCFFIFIAQFVFEFILQYLPLMFSKFVVVLPNEFSILIHVKTHIIQFP